MFIPYVVARPVDTVRQLYISGIGMTRKYLNHLIQVQRFFDLIPLVLEMENDIVKNR